MRKSGKRTSCRRGSTAPAPQTRRCDDRWLADRSHAGCDPERSWAREFAESVCRLDVPFFYRLLAAYHLMIAAERGRQKTKEERLNVEGLSTVFVPGECDRPGGRRRDRRSLRRRGD